MADGLIQVPVDSTGKKIDTSELTVGANTVERQRSVIAGAGATELADVHNTGASGTDFGLVTRNMPRKTGVVLSTIVLAGSGTFTGSWNDSNLDGTTFVEVAVRADQASGANGFALQETDDDTDSNFTRTITSVTVSANTTTFLYGPIRCRKWRVVYTNGGSAQGSFKLTSTSATIGDNSAFTQVISGSISFTAPQHVIVDSAPSTAVTNANLDSPLSGIKSTLDNIKTKTDNLDVLLSTRTKPADSQHVTVDNASVAITASALPLPSNAAQETGGNLATIASNTASGASRDVSDRAGRQLGHVTVDSAPLPSNAAQETGGNLATVATNLNIAQGAAATSVAGNLALAKVSDSRESYSDNYVQPFSLTTDGRLRVATSPADSELDFFSGMPALTNPEIGVFDFSFSVF